MDPLDLELKPLPQLLVERPERFVHQQERRIKDDGACQCHALLLAPGQFTRIAMGEVGHLDHVQRAFHAHLALGRADASERQRIGDVAVDLHVGEERVVLEHHADVALVRRHADQALSAYPQCATIQVRKAGYQVQRRGLARAARSKQRHELAGFDMERYAVKRAEVAVDLGGVAYVDSSAAIGLLRVHSRPFH